MKISFVINEPVQDATGGYKMVYMYANYLVRCGHEVTIYYWCRDGRLFTNYKIPYAIKFPIAYILAKKGPKWFPLDKKVDGKAIKDITEESICNSDVIIATAVNTANPVYRLSHIKGKKVYFIQDFENWECSDEEVYKTYSLGMKNIVVSNWLKEIVDLYSDDEATVISNGIDTNIFFDKKNERYCHSIVLQYRKASYKGPEYAIQVIKKLNEVYPDLRVSIISSDDSPEDLPSCCMFFQSITPEKVAEINNQSNVFICTSINEGYGLPGLEAMACGCAVCSSAYKGVFEYAIDGVNSLISPVRDVEKMVENVCNIFENPNLHDFLVKNGQLTIKQKDQKVTSTLFENTLKQINSLSI